MTRLPTVEIDEPPSPDLTAAPIEEEDHDDDLSINSSDLDDEGWLNVDNADAASAAASTASALGSSILSDLAVSSREPSDVSASEDEDEDDEEPAWPEFQKTRTELDIEDSLYADDDTPAASNAFEFKNSWIFPDPTSSNASLTTTGTITNNTPVHSFPNIRAIPRRTADSFIEQDESPLVETEAAAPIALAMPPPDAKKKTAPGNPFLAHPPGAEGKRWPVLPVLIGMLLLILTHFELSPFDVITMLSHKWGTSSTPTSQPPPPPPASGSHWALGTADLQIVKDTLAALTTSSAVAPKEIPTEAPTAPSEYSYVWSKLRKSGESSTDLIATTVANSLSVVPQFRRKTCQCPPAQCICPRAASLTAYVVDGLIAIDVYTRWMAKLVVDMTNHAGQWLRSEIELEVKYQRELLKALVKSPAVRAVVESAIETSHTMSDLYRATRERVCSDRRCVQAADRVRQLQARGWRGIMQARRGLDVALTRGQLAVDKARAVSTELLGGAVAGARSAGKRCSSKTSKGEKKTGGCKEREGKKRRRWSYKGKKTDPNQRLQCGFRGYGRGCDQPERAAHVAAQRRGDAE
ncbi:hypothetical protein CC85DRAFT_305615 [Cutaneotrichosporon oleaginosum]|uniref:Uncharacterized protein n=1 Tax=Cutaneotrichosporon oleaginosum TaxID=879819 RepID=A0A0J0XCM7_9TREE|nr:uncharacterized protein CC85DRAFT_305615 [Cutaneotrichosporon oleaginosum]KLT38833.1 hypothetical protein CC85DRAFT_305615 [Cutaneotrichosporon oleaginosum]TXT04723.1 hypothetical protein COLE_07542 [Cutaneotrichosporon oleaginosum]